MAEPARTGRVFKSDTSDTDMALVAQWQGAAIDRREPGTNPAGVGVLTGVGWGSGRAH